MVRRERWAVHFASKEAVWRQFVGVGTFLNGAVALMQMRLSTLAPEKVRQPRAIFTEESFWDGEFDRAKSAERYRSVHNE